MCGKCEINDRIKELKRIPASQLLPNPDNWRGHPDEQVDALRHLLARIGWADVCIVRETPEGYLLLDGHARVEIVGDAEVPCLVLDVDEEEAKIILASLDAVSRQATVLQHKLEDLLAEISLDNQALEDLFSELCEFTPEKFDDGKEYDESCADDVKTIICPKCEHEFPI